MDRFIAWLRAEHLPVAIGVAHVSDGPSASWAARLLASPDSLTPTQRDYLRDVATGATCRQGDDRFAALTRAFHTLASAPGVGPDEVNVQQLDAWASTQPIGTGAREAARFVLSLWDSRRQWQSGAFDIFRALATWDEKQRAVFTAWVQDPFRP